MQNKYLPYLNNETLVIPGRAPKEFNPYHKSHSLEGAVTVMRSILVDHLNRPDLLERYGVLPI